MAWCRRAAGRDGPSGEEVGEAAWASAGRGCGLSPESRRWAEEEEEEDEELDEVLQNPERFLLQFVFVVF